MSGFVTVKIRDRPHDVAVLGHDDTLFDAAPQAAGGRLSHLPGRFPGRDKKDSSRELLPFESPLYGGVRPYRGNGFPDDPVRVRPKQLIHSDLLTVPE